MILSKSLNLSKALLAPLSNERDRINYLYRSFQNYSLLSENPFMFVEKVQSVSDMAMSKSESLLGIKRKTVQHIYKMNYCG